jgi:arsenate reductase
MSDTVTVYGISNCDTIKKAKNWLTNHEIEFEFHDYRKQGLDIEWLNHWVNDLGWEALVNRRGTSWRKLTDETRDNMDAESAIKVMLEVPAIIKRPLLVKNNQAYLGFSEQQYSRIF